MLLTRFIFPNPLCVVSLPPSLPAALDFLPQGLHCVGIWAGSRAEALALLLDPDVLRWLDPPPSSPSTPQQRVSPSPPGADPSASAAAAAVVIVACPSSASMDGPPGATAGNAEAATSIRALPLGQWTALARRSAGDADDGGGDQAVLEVMRLPPAAAAAAWLGQAGLRLIR